MSYNEHIMIIAGDNPMLPRNVGAQETFDAGDMYILTKNAKKIFDPKESDTFNECKFIEPTGQLIKKTLLGDEKTRFAVVGEIGNANVVYIKGLPSLPYTATEGEEKASKDKYGTQFVVKPTSKVRSGVIHNQVDRIFNQIEETGPILIEPLELGLSWYLEKVGEKEWTLTLCLRSTNQYKFVDFNDIAENCFLFDERIMTKEGDFGKGREGYTGYNIGRTLGPKWSAPFAKGLQSAINKYLKEKKTDTTVKVNIEDYDYGIKYEKIWNQIRHDKQAIAEYLEKTVYIASGLIPGKPGYFWIQKTDEQIVEDVLTIAKKNNITLNLNRIPKEFKDNQKALPPIMLAIKHKKLAIIEMFIQNGIKIDEILKAEPATGASLLLAAIKENKMNPLTSLIECKADSQQATQLAQEQKNNAVNVNKAVNMLNIWNSNEELDDYLKKLIISINNFCEANNSRLERNNFEKAKKIREKFEKTLSQPWKNEDKNDLIKILCADILNIVRPNGEEKTKSNLQDNLTFEASRMLHIADVFSQPTPKPLFIEGDIDESKIKEKDAEVNVSSDPITSTHHTMTTTTSSVASSPYGMMEASSIRNPSSAPESKQTTDSPKPILLGSTPREDSSLTRRSPGINDPSGQSKLLEALGKFSRKKPEGEEKEDENVEKKEDEKGLVARRNG